MDTKLEEKDLMAAGIFELRKIGRDIGVKSPTSKDKNQLVGDILDIVNGRSEPYVAMNRRGRPPKGVDNNANAEIFSKIITNIGTDTLILDQQAQYEGLSNFIKKYQRELNEEMPVNNEIEVLGYLELVDNYGYIRDKNDTSYSKVIYIPDVKIREYALRKGDLIFARGRRIHQLKPAILLQIIEINDNDKVPARPIFDNMEISNVSNEFKIFEQLIEEKRFVEIFPIIKGSRNLISLKSNEMIVSNLYNLAKTFARTKDAKVMYVVPESLPENKLFLRDIEGIEVFFTQFDQTPSEIISKVDLSIERAKRLTEQGNNVILLVEGLDKIIKNYIYSTNNTSNKEYMAGLYIKKLYALARTLKNGSLTVIGSIHCKDNITKDIKDEISTISKTTII